MPPIGKLENVYCFKPVKTFCSDVRDCLGITLTCIFPVSNYYEELVPIEAKNAMSLMALWNAVFSGQRYIMHKREIEED